jgi:hypothetical protein
MAATFAIDIKLRPPKQSQKEKLIPRKVPRFSLLRQGHTSCRDSATCAAVARVGVNVTALPSSPGVFAIPRFVREFRVESRQTCIY